MYAVMSALIGANNRYVVFRHKPNLNIVMLSCHVSYLESSHILKKQCDEYS